MENIGEDDAVECYLSEWKQYFIDKIEKGSSCFNDWESMENYFRGIDISKNIFQNFIVSLQSIYEMHNQGICPFLLFSFGECHWNRDRYMFARENAEFCLMYLYRTVSYQMPYDISSSICISGEGATSNVYMSSDKSIVIKVPKTYASYNYLLQQEYENLIELKKTSIKYFLPEQYNFDFKSHCLSHERIVGDSAEDYLFHNISFEKNQIESLKKFYESYMNRENRDLILDIHPGNFIWSSSKKQWFLIDLGSLPFIGKEYYEFYSFDEYFQSIWLQREQIMKRYPIRSIDFEINDKIYIKRKSK